MRIVSATRHLLAAPCAAFALYFLTGCADVQMGYNVLTYDHAVAETANELLLLNAVRTSQHYPASFTSVGQVLSSPPVSGNVASTFTFLPGGLQTYNFNPSVAASAGYGSFALGNLNYQSFMERVRGPIPPRIISSFYNDPSWPVELIDLIYLQSLAPSENIVRVVDAERKSQCATTNSLCFWINKHVEEYAARCNDNYFSDINIRMREFLADKRTYYNTAANYCHYTRFRIFLEELRVTHTRICSGKAIRGCVRPTERSALQMINYLGELIAAQNYLEQPFMPRVLFGRSVGPKFEFADVPLFVVIRSGPEENAAVTVQHRGITFYIPQPDFGSPDEARSLQTLDLVVQTVEAATQQQDLPKTVPTVAVVGSK